MQEKLLESNLADPSLTSINKIRIDIENFGYCLDSTKKQIIDEEKTHAAEILCSASMSADIPRNYEIKDNDLVDQFGASLKLVLNNGIKYLKENYSNVDGCEWELSRRNIELQNLNNIVALPTGIVGIEISATDLTKPEDQRLKFGYGGDTLVRVNYKKNTNELEQRNIIVKTSDIKKINHLRKLIDPTAETVKNADEALGDMLFVSATDSSISELIAKINNFATEQHSKVSPAGYILSLIKRSKKQSANSWDFINNNDDIFEAMFSEMQKMSLTNSDNSRKINEVRAGTWQILLDKFRGEEYSEDNISVAKGIMRAKAIGAVFTSCGGTISVYNEILTGNSFTNYLDRYEVISSLLERINDSGSCHSCGTNGLLYGCGVYCRSCNLVWCQEYLRTGRQLSDTEIIWRKYYYYK